MKRPAERRCRPGGREKAREPSLASSPITLPPALAHRGSDLSASASGSTFATARPRPAAHSFAPGAPRGHAARVACQQQLEDESDMDSISRSMDAGSHSDANEFSIPLLVRKLSVFRKGLVRERNLRTQAESSVDRLREKLKASQAALNDEALKAAQHLSRAEDLERRVKRSAAQRSTESRVDSIFSSFGTKHSVEKETKL